LTITILYIYNTFTFRGYYLLIMQKMVSKMNFYRTRCG